MAQDERARERTQTELEVERPEIERRIGRLLEKAIESIDVGVTITDAKGRILFTNQADARMHGYRREDLIGKEARMFAPAELWNPAKLEKQSQSSSWHRESINVRTDGTAFPVELISQTFTDQTNEDTRILTVCEDITARKERELELQRKALYDSLTNLPNRALLIDRLERAILYAKRRTSHRFAVLFLDIDRFKSVNDTLGHMAGDQLLVEVAHRLMKCVRTVDTVARVGGDEFVILIDDVRDVNKVLRVAHRINIATSRHFSIAGREFQTSVSTGVAFYDRSYEKPEEMLHDADAAMYRAKRMGGARYELFFAGV